MGNCNSISSFPSIVLDYRPTEITELYKQCEAGNVEEARKLLAVLPFLTVNCSEINGSTALHVASSRGYGDVVRLLVQEYGVIRHRRNADGLTAYQVAANDEIREIFHRPRTNDQYSSTLQGITYSMFAIFFPASKRPPPPWIHSTS
ncbi:unnamed protein product, partial [Rotaria sordida]